MIVHDCSVHCLCSTQSENACAIWILREFSDCADRNNYIWISVLNIIIRGIRVGIA